MSAAKDSAPEFSRPVLLAQLGDKPHKLDLSAEPEERAALAERFELQSLGRLDGQLEITREGSVVTLTGALKAKLAQTCVVSGEPVPVSLDEPVNLRFVPTTSDRPSDEEEEIELSEADCDTLTHDGRVIDAGEALAETMALALDPFPRARNADKAAKAAGIKSEEEAGAFGALAELKAKMAKRD